MVNAKFIKTVFSLIICISFCCILYKNAQQSYTIDLETNGKRMIIDEENLVEIFDNQSAVLNDMNIAIFYDAEYHLQGNYVKEIYIYVIIRTKGSSKINSRLTCNERLFLESESYMSYDGSEVIEAPLYLTKLIYGDCEWQSKERFFSGDKLTVFRFKFFPGYPEAIHRNELHVWLKSFTYTATGYF